MSERRDLPPAAAPDAGKQKDCAARPTTINSAAGSVWDAAPAAHQERTEPTPCCAGTMAGSHDPHCLHFGKRLLKSVLIRNEQGQWALAAEFYDYAYFDRVQAALSGAPARAAAWQESLDRIPSFGGEDGDAARVTFWVDKGAFDWHVMYRDSAEHPKVALFTSNEKHCCVIARVLNRLFEQSARAAEWQPIESAPKERLTAHHRHRERVLLSDGEYRVVGFVGDSVNHFMWRDEYFRTLVPQPTHWMPLPLPPCALTGNSDSTK